MRTTDLFSAGSAGAGQKVAWLFNTYASAIHSSGTNIQAAALQPPSGGALRFQPGPERRRVPQQCERRHPYPDADILERAVFDRLPRGARDVAGCRRQQPERGLPRPGSDHSRCAGTHDPHADGCRRAWLGPSATHPAGLSFARTSDFFGSPTGLLARRAGLFFAPTLSVGADPVGTAPACSLLRHPTPLRIGWRRALDGSLVSFSICWPSSYSPWSAGSRICSLRCRASRRQRPFRCRARRSGSPAASI